MVVVVEGHGAEVKVLVAVQQRGSDGLGALEGARRVAGDVGLRVGLQRGR